MKRLVFILAALGVVTSANAAEDVEFKHAGEFRVRYQNDDNPAAQKGRAGQDRADVNHRFKYNLTARKGENLQAHASLLHVAEWGNNTGTNSTGNSDNGTPNGVAAGTNRTYATDNVLLVNRAWGWWKASDVMSFKVGRVGIEIADGAVFAENDWEAVPTAHEGLLAMWDLDFGKITALYIKTDEFGLTNGWTSNDPEQNIFGVSFDAKNLPEAIKIANLHILQINKDEVGTTAPTTANPKRSAQRFGLTVGGDVAGFLYKVTAAFVTGKDKAQDAAGATSTTISQNMFDVMAGYQMPEVMNLKATVGYHMDSGDKDATDNKSQTYDSFYYDRHNYAGLMDVVNWGNLTYYNVNVSAMPAEDLEAGIGYYIFSRTVGNSTTTAGTNFGERYSGGLLGVDTTKKNLGSELDLYVNKSYDGGFKIGARAGMFTPGNAIKESATPQRDQTIFQYFLQASYNF